MNKKLIKILSVSLIVVSLIGGIVYAQSMYPDNYSPSKQRTISVSGEGTIKVKPDIAYITLGVKTEDKVAKVAQQKNAELMDKVTKSFTAMGIAKEDIKTTNYSIYPKYEYQKFTGKSVIIGYEANNAVEVTVRDIEKTGQIIDASVEEGVNTSSGIRFGISDNNKYYNEALKLAVKSAKDKAKTIAETLGVKIDVPESVTETSNNGPIYTYPSYAMDAMGGVEKSVSTPISQGELEVKASVSMVYGYGNSNYASIGTKEY